ncbi:hypothetical protein [Leptolyngbya sp. 7M]|uniref:hypothetical protein n=1 Tax=Leptolyngbya sp. 7M TaxID=2812896 RepID=UPI001B8D8079|nr:hypothetical protein [Leptolyngbya sp. 7M]QYO65291.1 hypothetical protein JVX88_00455 [Leptolyngbya sp. 7M]
MAILPAFAVFGIIQVAALEIGGRFGLYPFHILIAVNGTAIALLTTTGVLIRSAGMPDLRMLKMRVPSIGSLARSIWAKRSTIVGRRQKQVAEPGEAIMLIVIRKRLESAKQKSVGA